MKIIHIEHEELEKGIQVIVASSTKENKPKVFEGKTEYILIAFEAVQKEKPSSNNRTDDETIEEIYELLDDGEPVAKIAEKYGLTRQTIYNFKKEKDEMKEDELIIDVDVDN